MATNTLASPAAALSAFRHGRRAAAVLSPTAAASPPLRGISLTRLPRASLSHSCLPRACLSHSCLPGTRHLRPRKSSHAGRGPGVAHHSVIVPRADFVEDEKRAKEAREAKEASKAAEEPRGTEQQKPVGHHKHSVRSFEDEPGVKLRSSGAGAYESVELTGEEEEGTGAPPVSSSPSSSSARGEEEGKGEEEGPGRVGAVSVEDTQGRSPEEGGGGQGFAKARDEAADYVTSTAAEAGDYMEGRRDDAERAGQQAVDYIEDRTDEAVRAGKQAVGFVEDRAEDTGKAVSDVGDYVRDRSGEAQRATGRAVESGGKQTQQMAQGATDSFQSGVAEVMDTVGSAAKSFVGTVQEKVEEGQLAGKGETLEDIKSRTSETFDTPQAQETRRMRADQGRD